MLSYLCVVAARTERRKKPELLESYRVSGADPDRHYRAIPKFWERTETLRRWQPVIRTTCMSSVDRNSPVDGAKCASTLRRLAVRLLLPKVSLCEQPRALGYRRDILKNAVIR